MNLAYLLAVGSAIVYGAADFAGGLTTRRAGTIAAVLLSQASGLALLALLLPLLPDATPSKDDLLWGVAAGVTGAVGVALLYRALAIGTMSVVAPITAVCAVAIPVVVSLLLGERPQPIALAGMALGIVSIVLVSQQRAASQASGTSVSRYTGVGTAFAAGVAIGFFFLTFAQTDTDAGLWPILVARLVSVTLFIAIALVGRHAIRVPGRVLTMAIVAGGLDMLANALYLLAVRSGPLSIVVTLSSLYPASTVLLARLVLKERLSGWQMTGVGCALAAVVLIVRGGQ